MKAQRSWLLLLQWGMVGGFMALALSQCVQVRLEQTVSRILDKVERDTGLRLEYTSVHYRLLSRITLRKVRVSYGGLEIDVGDLSVAHRLSLSGRPQFVLSAVMITQADMRVLAGGGGGRTFRLPKLPFRLVVKKSRLTWSGAGYAVRLQLPLLLLEPEDSVEQVLAKGQLAVDRAGEEVFASHFDGQGFVSKKGELVQMLLNLSASRVQNWALRPIAVQISLSPTGLALVNKKADEELDFHFNLNFAEGSSSVNVLLRQFRLQKFLLETGVNIPPPWWDAPVTGAVTLQTGQRGGLRYLFDLTHKSSQLSLRAQGEGSHEKVRIDNFALAQERLFSLSFQGDLFYRIVRSQGVARFAWNGAKGPRLAGQLSIRTIDANTLALTSERLEVNGSKEMAVTAEVVREQKDQYRVQALSFLRGEDWLQARALIRPREQEWAKVDFQTSPTGLDVQPLSSWGLLPADWIKAVQSVDANGKAVFARQGWDVVIPQLHLRAVEPTSWDLRSYVRVSHRDFEFRELKLTTLENPTGVLSPLQGNLRGSFARGRFKGYLLRQPVDVAWLARDGAIYLESEAFQARLERGSYALVTHDFVLPWAGEATARLRGAFLFTKAEEWSAQASGVELVLLRGGRLLPQQLSFDAAWRPGKLAITTLLWQQFSTPYRGQLTIDSREGQYQVSVQLSYEDEHAQLDMTYRSPRSFQLTSSSTLRLERLTGHPLLSGLLQSQLKVERKGRLSVAGDVSLEDGRIFQRTTSLKTHFAYHDEAVVLSGLTGSFGRLHVSRAALALNPTMAHASLGYRVKTAQGWIPGAIRGRVAFQQELALRGVEEVPPFSGLLHLDEARWAGQVLWPEVLADISWSRKSLLIKTKQDDSFRFRYRAGWFDLQVKDRFPLFVQAQGRYAGGTLTGARLKVAGPAGVFNALAPLDAQLGQPLYRVDAGDIEMDVALEGALADPMVKGEMKLRNIQLTAAHLAENPQLFNATFVAEDHVLALRPLSLVFPQGELVAPGYELGYVKLRNFFPERYYFLFRTKANGIPGKYQLGNTSFAGVVSGEALLRGDASQGQLTGEVHFENLSIDMQNQVKEERPWSPDRVANGNYAFSLSLKLNTGKKVLFRRDPFVEARGQPGDTVSLYYSTTDRGGSLSGTVHFPWARIGSASLGYLSEGQGVLLFNESLPSFNPLLQFSSRTSVINRQGIPTEITLSYRSQVRDLAEGDFPVLTSSPPIAEDEAKILLLSRDLGVDERAQAWEMLPSFAVQVGEDALSRQLSQELQDAIGFVDRIDLRTSVFRNIVAQQLAGRNVTEDTQGLFHYFDGSSISLSAYLDPNNTLLFTTGLRSRYAPTSQQESLSIAGMELIPEVGLTFLTPFATISAQLGLRDFGQLFVPESRISVEWTATF